MCRRFLKTLREVTASNGILLIFDEIVAFRISPAGAQGVFGCVRFERFSPVQSFVRQFSLMF